MSKELKRFAAALLACLALAPAATLAAEEVAAVISPGPGPYRAAFESFRRKLDAPVAAFSLPEEPPSLAPGTRVVVAFGSAAALRDYPERVTLIVCLAPGVSPARLRSSRPSVYIHMMPPPGLMLREFKKLQPGLKRLGVFWNSDLLRGYLGELEEPAAFLGMEIVAARVVDPSGLPDALRDNADRIDAMWLPPDPKIVTPQGFQTLKQFSWDRRIPLYAPTAGLSSAGAAASVGVSPEQIGEEAARLARKSLDGYSLPRAVYPESLQLTINADSAAKAGLAISLELQRRAEKALP